MGRRRFLLAWLAPPRAGYARVLQGRFVEGQSLLEEA
jgi:hypothetical protein